MTTEPLRAGRYELAMSLGQGALGDAWAGAAADGPEQGRVVTLRRIRAEGRAAAARIAEKVKALRHPKIAAVLDVQELEGELIVASEHVDGEWVSALLHEAVSSKSPIPPAVAVAIVRDAADALIAAREHIESTVSAITPDTLVVAAFGETMLTEPGILAALGGASKRGPSLAYRAPEELCALPGGDERSDVYSLGVLLWEMLANRPLFRSHAASEARADQEVRELVLSTTVPALGSLPRSAAPLPDSLVVLVGRALFREPERRFPTLAAFKQALEALPRDLVAPSEQVAVTLERLARATLESRRDALTHMEQRMSLSPESMRSTARPAAPEAPVEVKLPALPPTAFGLQEAPTKPRRKLTPVPGAATETPKIVSRPASVAPPAIEPRESNSTGISVVSEPALGARPGPRRIAPLVVVAVGVVAILIAFLMRSKSEPAPEGAKPAPTETPSAMAPVTSIEPSASAVPAEPEPSAKAAPEPSASSTRKRPRDERPEPKPKTPGAYRPKGI